MMRLRGLLLALLGLTLIAGGPLGCDRGEESQAEGPTVAFVMKTLNNPFFIDMEKGAQDAADRLGVNLIVQAAERELDIEKQMQIVENLIQRKVDALCITPSGSREIVPAIAKANEAGIPVLIVDTRVDAEAARAAGAETVTFIGSDNYEGGAIAGEALAAALGGQGKIAILEGIPGHETGDARMGGFREAIAKHPGIEIVASQTANWERDQGYNVLQNIMQGHPDLNGLFACNDLMALGAIEAIDAAGKGGAIMVVGFDAIDDARTAIREGRMLGSVAQSPEEMGRVAVEKAVEILNGGSVGAVTEVKVEMIDAGSVGAQETLSDE